MKKLHAKQRRRAVRRNVGFLHAPAGAAPGVGLAPLYDASSAAGTRYDKGAAVGLAWPATLRACRSA